MQTPAAETKNQIERGDRFFWIVTICLTVVFGVITLLNAVLIVKSWIYPDEIPTVFSHNAAIVGTDVMESDRSDAVFAGDLAFLKKTDYEDVEVGKIAIYTYDDKVIVGRVTQRNVDGTYSVACDSPDYWHMSLPYLTESNHFGTIVGRIPYLGIFARFMLSIPGLILFILIPFMIAIYIMILEIRDSRREGEQEDEPEPLPIPEPSDADRSGSEEKTKDKQPVAR